MGKSTLSRFLLLRCIEATLISYSDRPFRKLSSSVSVLQFIREELNALDERVDDALVLRLLQRGDFIIFLDGYDEISGSEREVVTADLQSFISKARRVICSCLRHDPSCR